MYLPYTLTFDPDTKTYCAEGIDRDGYTFTEGAGHSSSEAESTLREAVIEILMKGASLGHDFTVDFMQTVPEGTHITLTEQELQSINSLLLSHPNKPLVYP